MAVKLPLQSQPVSSEGYVVVALLLSRGSTVNDDSKHVARAEAQGMI